MVVIRLTRGGRKKLPFYGIVAADSRKPRDGRFLEKLGTWDPLKKKFNLDTERYDYWVSVGGQPSDTVKRLHKKFVADAK